MEWILSLLKKEIEYFGTADPFEIAAGRNILIRYFPLGETYGFYMKNVRQQVITINENLDEPRKLYTCAHELGHAILHPMENTPFLNQNTLRSREKIEVQAHYWATLEILKYRCSEKNRYDTYEEMVRENGLPYEWRNFFDKLKLFVEQDKMG